MSSLTHLTLPPSQVRKALVRCFKAKLTPIVTSSPGIGKSDITRSVADEFRMKLIDFRVPQADTTDFNGLPFPNDKGKAEFLPFDTFPLAGDPMPAHPDGGVYNGWILFLDELTSAPKHLQSPAYKLILDRLVGTHQLHERVMICAAGNLASDKAIVHEMSTALQSRLIHIELALHHGEWMEWAIQNDVDSRILAFLQFKPELLHRFNPDHNEKTFACPRTWWFANRLIKGEPVTMNDLALLGGTISPGPAQEFISFVSVFDQLPKLEAIIADPENVVIPHEPSIKFALATVLAEKMDASNVTPLATFINRLPIESRVLCMRMLRQRSPHLIREVAVQKIFQPILSRL